MKAVKKYASPLRPGCKKQVPVTVRFIWLRNYYFNCYPSKKNCWCPSWLFSLGGHPWVSMESMDIHGIHGYPWNPWISMDIHGCPWISMDSMDINGYPRNPWIPHFRKYKNYLFPKYKKSNPYEMNLLYKKNENKGSP